MFFCHNLSIANYKLSDNMSLTYSCLMKDNSMEMANIYYSSHQQLSTAKLLCRFPLKILKKKITKKQTNKKKLLKKTCCFHFHFYFYVF